MSNEPEPTFESALHDLERVVEDLEGGEPELSSALAKYEKGVKLLAHCQRILEQAERSISLLNGVEPDGSPVGPPFDDATPPDPNPKPAKEKSSRKKTNTAPEAADDPSIPF